METNTVKTFCGSLRVITFMNQATGQKGAWVCSSQEVFEEKMIQLSKKDWITDIEVTNAILK